MRAIQSSDSIAIPRRYKASRPCSCDRRPGMLHWGRRAPIPRGRALAARTAQGFFFGRHYSSQSPSCSGLPLAQLTTSLSAHPGYSSLCYVELQYSHYRIIPIHPTLAVELHAVPAARRPHSATSLCHFFDRWLSERLRATVGDDEQLYNCHMLCTTLRPS
jgi:hypothetical protein